MMNYQDYLFKTVRGIKLLLVPRRIQTEVVKLCHERGCFAKKKTDKLIK